MKKSVKIKLALCFILPFSAHSKADLLFEQDQLKMTHKNFYFYRDFRNGAFNPSGANKFVPNEDKEGYRSEWAQGLIINYDSGFHDLGGLQFGADAYALAGLKLYSDPFKTGTNLLKIDSNGVADDYYAEIGGSIKLKLNQTVLNYGNLFPNVPVLSVSTVRLLPSVATGVTLEDKSFKNLNINAGYFYRINPVDSTEHLNYFTTDYGVGIKGDSVKYLGAHYKFDHGHVSAYLSEFDDVWTQTYLSAGLNKSVTSEQIASFNTTVYSNQDRGQKLAGEIDTTLASFMLGYQYQQQKFSVAYQQVFGDEPMDWVGFSTMGANIWFANAAQFATFSEANEKSIQAKYEIDLKSILPGLSFMGRYVYGWDMDNQKSKNQLYTSRHIYDPSIDNKHWERDLQLNYNVQSGFAKGLDIKLRQATHRATKGYRYNDIDEIRMIFEYPWSF